MRLKKLFRKIKRLVVYLYDVFLPEPKQHIIVLGKEKSGTTVIAGLLSKNCSVSAQLDIASFWDVEEELYANELPFGEFYKRNKMVFKNKIVKEPGFTYIYPILKKFFPHAKFVFIIRDPRDNIKSIFSRLGISGTIQNFDSIDEKKMHKSWVNVLKNTGLNLSKDNPIQNAAERWAYTANVYLKNQNEMILVRYEDFVCDKLGTIRDLAAKLGLNTKSNIDHLLDKQFQPAADKNMKWMDFFGENNLAKINNVCKVEMKLLGYE
jgi:hypothetical protein